MVTLYFQLNHSHRKCLTLDCSRGDRAMLIKNNDGDWGIIKGTWTGYVKGKPPKVRGKLFVNKKFSLNSLIKLYISIMSSLHLIFLVLCT